MELITKIKKAIRETLNKNSVFSAIKTHTTTTFCAPLCFRSVSSVLKKVGCALCVIFLLSCEDVIQVDLKKGETLLVVDAFVNNLPQTQTVRLTFTADYFSNTNTPPVLGAAVTLLDITNSKTYTFTPDGNGNYFYVPFINDSMAQIGHKYQLSVLYNGSNYTSLTKLNRTTKIDTIIFKNSRRDFGNNPADTSSPREYFPYLIARDTIGVNDYYWIKTYKNGAFFNGPRQINPSQDAGGIGTDGMPFIPPIAFFSLVDEPLYRNDACTIEIHSITADTYDFLLQMQTQMNNAGSGLFATTPENVKTNIKLSSGSGMKAIGWFSMSATVSKTVVAGN